MVPLPLMPALLLRWLLMLRCLRSQEDVSTAALTAHCLSRSPRRYLTACLREFVRHWVSYTLTTHCLSRSPCLALRKMFPRQPGKYLLIELDRGGFNNVRLAFEHHVVIALITGRT